LVEAAGVASAALISLCVVSVCNHVHPVSDLICFW